MTEIFSPLKQELYKIVDSFMLEVMSEYGHDRTISQLNKDRHLLASKLLKLFDEREEVVIDEIRTGVEMGLQLTRVVQGCVEMKGNWMNVDDVLALLPAPRGNRTLCYFCHKPIHISKLAGFFGANGKNNAFCKNTVCLVEFANWDRENNVQLCDDFKTRDLSISNEGTEGL